MTGPDGEKVFLEVDRAEAITSSSASLFDGPAGFSLLGSGRSGGGGVGGSGGGLLGESIDKMLQTLDRKRFTQVMQARPASRGAPRGEGGGGLACVSGGQGRVLSWPWIA